MHEIKYTLKKYGEDSSIRKFILLLTHLPTAKKRELSLFYEKNVKNQTNKLYKNIREKVI